MIRWTPQAELCSPTAGGCGRPQPCCLDAYVLQWVKEEVVKRKTKTTRKKIFNAIYNAQRPI